MQKQLSRTCVSKTRALLMATACVGRPTGRETRWRFIAPHSVRNLAGPTQEYTATCHSDIQRMRTLLVVEIALVLMGHDGQLVPDGLEGSAGKMLESVLANPNNYLRKD